MILIYSFFFGFHGGPRSVAMINFYVLPCPDIFIRITTQASPRPSTTASYVRPSQLDVVVRVDLCVADFSTSTDCSEITAKLMFLKLGVSPAYVRPLASTTRAITQSRMLACTSNPDALAVYTVYQVENTEVTLLPANHCPVRICIASC